VLLAVRLLVALHCGGCLIITYNYLGLLQPPSNNLWGKMERVSEGWL
jgi:hypothetical protein